MVVALCFVHLSSIALWRTNDLSIIFTIVAGFSIF